MEFNLSKIHIFCIFFAYFVHIFCIFIHNKCIFLHIKCIFNAYMNFSCAFQSEIMDTIEYGGHLYCYVHHAGTFLTIFNLSPKQNPFLMLIKLLWWVRTSFSVFKQATLDILVEIQQNISDISANIFSFINGTTNTVYSVWVMSLENSICDAEISSYIFKKSGKILGKSCHSCQLKSSEATQKLFPPPMS